MEVFSVCMSTDTVEHSKGLENKNERNGMVGIGTSSDLLKPSKSYHCDASLAHARFTIY